MIRVDPPTEDARKLWLALGELAEAFGRDTGWCLVGGLMVQLHAYEHGASVRPTEDIDLLGDARQRPSGTEALARVVSERGGDPATPPGTDPTLGYRFEVGGQLVEILGPEGLRSAAKTVGNLETIEVRGGTQALRRAETVTVSIAGGPPTDIRRPNLLGAILLKARALKVAREKATDHRDDLIVLLALVDDPETFAEREGLTTSERRWLREAREDLEVQAGDVGHLVTEGQLRRARLALELMAPA